MLGIHKRELTEHSAVMSDGEVGISKHWGTLILVRLDNYGDLNNSPNFLVSHRQEKTAYNPRYTGLEPHL